MNAEKFWNNRHLLNNIHKITSYKTDTYDEFVDWYFTIPEKNQPLVDSFIKELAHKSTHISKSHYHISPNALKLAEKLKSLDFIVFPYIERVGTKGYQSDGVWSWSMETIDGFTIGSSEPVRKILAKKSILEIDDDNEIYIKVNK